MTWLDTAIAVGGAIGIVAGLQMVRLAQKRATGLPTAKRDDHIAEIWMGIGVLVIGAASILQAR